jgi:uncharacterized protein (UPF0248 family)
MQPIHELLNQIRWDPNFTGEFEIAFVDRAKPGLRRIPMRSMRFPASRESLYPLPSRMRGSIFALMDSRLRGNDGIRGFTEQRFSFELLTDEDQVVSIPLHRIRQVYRNRELIWSRPEAT